MPDAQPARNAEVSRAAPEDWPALLRRCEALELTARELGLEHETIEAALAAIGAAKKAPAWKAQQRKTLRIKLQRAIAAADAVAVDDAGAEEAAGADAEAGGEPAAVAAMDERDGAPVSHGAASLPPYPDGAERRYPNVNDDGRPYRLWRDATGRLRVTFERAAALPPLPFVPPPSPLPFPAEAAAALAALSLQQRVQREVDFEEAAWPSGPRWPPPSLEAHVGRWVRLVGLTVRVELNGAVVRLGAWHEERERWQVRQADARRCSTAARRYDRVSAYQTGHAIPQRRGARCWTEASGPNARTRTPRARPALRLAE